MTKIFDNLKNMAMEMGIEVRETIGMSGGKIGITVTKTFRHQKDAYTFIQQLAKMRDKHE